ncbi:Cna B-type domain-containing protein, partial [Ligilactobacillus ceti]|uniref:Cna B-type domain-containing protein n=1 Tax=Ligilactobacillus ceti TaxID=395085 RepID=UPI00128F5DCC
DKVKDYTTSIEGFNVTNTHKPGVTQVEGKKTWNDNNNQDGLRPTEITINLLADGKKVDSRKVTAKDKWEYSFTKLPVKKNGKNIVYTISEDKVKDYTTSIDGFNVTNTHKPGVTQVEGKKTWNDNNNQDGLRPTEITIRLYDGKDEVKHVTVTAKDKWKYSFTNLPMNKDGKKIVYTIKEDKVKNYTTSIEGFNVTNTHKPAVTQVEGKKTWNDNNNQDGLR